MSKVKVKTINGEDQLIDFEDQMTVLNLKERINERLNIPVDSQRLIYCGRVLDNDKKLQEYDLNNKVIHLVNSPPRLNETQNEPSNAQSQNNQSSDSLDSNPDPPTGGSSHFSINLNFTGSRVHSNAESRFNNLQRILGYINLAIDKLERDPNVPSPTFEQSFQDAVNAGRNEQTNRNNVNLLDGAFPDPLQGLANSITQVSVISVDSSGNQVQQSNGNLMDSLGFDLNDIIMSSLDGRGAAQASRQASGGSNNSNTNLGSNLSGNSSSNNNHGATSASASSNVSATNAASSQNTNSHQQSRSSNPYFSSLFSNFTNNIIGIGGSALGFGSPGTSRDNNTRNNSRTQTSSSTANPRSDQSSRSQQQSSSNQNNADSAAAANGQIRRRITWAEYANLLDSVRQTQERFMPHFEAFQRSLLEPYGTYNYQRSEDLQTRFRMTSRVMHHLAHVYHMLSDFHISYLHQQDHNVQIYHPIASSPLHFRRPTTELRMNLSSNSGSNNNLNDLLNNATASNDNNSASARPEDSSSNNPTNPRRDLPTSGFVPVGFLSGIIPGTQQQQTDSTNDNSNNSQDLSVEQEIHNLLRSSLPNLSSSGSTIVIQTISSGGSNRNLSQQSSNNDSTNNSNTSNNNNQQQSASSRPVPLNLSGLFNFGSSSNRSQSSQQNASATASNTIATNSTSNQNNSNQPNRTSSSASGQQSNTPGYRGSFISQRVRIPTSRMGIGSTLPYQSHILNFDPHLPCTSTYLIPEMQARLEVDYQSIPQASNNNTDSNAHATRTTNSNASSTSNQQQQQQRARSSASDLTRQPVPSARPDVEALELFNDLRILFSTYVEHDELIRRIDNLPRLANDSLKSFIDSMNILNLVSRDNSNITLELFMILAQKISVVEFLKILFMQDSESNLKCLKCLNRAQNSMVSYARTNLLFNTEEPFDTSGCVDELLKVWKRILSASFDELKHEFTDRTFSALVSELRANLSVFLRTFTRTFSEDDGESSFASSLYLAIQRLMVDFHTSLAQMFRSPKNLMRAYKNLLMQIFPDANVRSLIIGILSYRIPAIDEHERQILERIRFSSRINDLSSPEQLASNRSLTSSSRLTNSQRANQYSSSTSVASSNSYVTPMEIDLDLDYDFNYNSEPWAKNCPRNWLRILSRDREKISSNRQNLLNSRQRFRFSSIYKEAYKKN